MSCFRRKDKAMDKYNKYVFENILLDLIYQIHYIKSHVGININTVNINVCVIQINSD